MTNGILSDEELLAMLPLIAISNHPSPNVNLKRKAQFLSNYPSLEEKVITLRLLITHYDSNGNYTTDPLPDVVFEITADTKNWVDPTQSTIPRVPEGTANAVREWDFWWNLLYNTNSETQAQIYQAQVAGMDAAGLFNVYPSLIYQQ